MSCLNSAFKFSGSSVRPAYPGFIVIKNPHVGTNNIVSPRKSKVPTYGETKQERLGQNKIQRSAMQYKIIQFYKPGGLET